MKSKNVMLALLLAAMIVVPAIAVADVDFSSAEDDAAGDDEKKETSPWFVGIFGILFVVAIAVPLYMRMKEEK